NIGVIKLYSIGTASRQKGVSSVEKLGSRRSPQSKEPVAYNRCSDRRERSRMSVNGVAAEIVDKRVVIDGRQVRKLRRGIEGQLAREQRRADWGASCQS